jgi:hypothetical protein
MKTAVAFAVLAALVSAAAAQDAPETTAEPSGGEQLKVSVDTTTTEGPPTFVTEFKVDYCVEDEEVATAIIVAGLIEKGTINDASEVTITYVLEGACATQRLRRRQVDVAAGQTTIILEFDDPGVGDTFDVDGAAAIAAVLDEDYPEKQGKPLCCVSECAVVAKAPKSKGWKSKGGKYVAKAAPKAAATTTPAPTPAPTQMAPTPAPTQMAPTPAPTPAPTVSDIVFRAARSKSGGKKGGKSSGKSAKTKNGKAMKTPKTAPKGKAPKAKQPKLVGSCDCRECSSKKGKGKGKKDAGKKGKAAKANAVPKTPKSQPKSAKKKSATTSRLEQALDSLSSNGSSGAAALAGVIGLAVGLAFVTVRRAHRSKPEPLEHVASAETEVEQEQVLETHPLIESAASEPPLNVYTYSL